MGLVKKSKLIEKLFFSAVNTSCFIPAKWAKLSAYCLQMAT